ncbi:MAG: hypothetical protein AAGN35_18090 [Bacteroidota bacterium]
MEKLTKIFMICGLMIGSIMFGSLAYAQTEASAPTEGKVVSATVTDAAPAKKKSCAMTCAGMKKATAVGGNVTETTASAGSNAEVSKKKACSGAVKTKACSKSKSAALSGSVTETSASAGSNKQKVKSKKACTGVKKSCCKSKSAKMTSGEVQ